MKVLNWNIDKGGRSEKIADIVRSIESWSPEIIVLPEFRKDRAHLTKYFENFDLHVPEASYSTGNQVCTLTLKGLGFRSIEVEIPFLKGLVSVIQNEDWTVVGVFFPKKGREEASIHPFLEWIQEDPLQLSTRPTILTGDFNHGVRAGEWNKGRHGSEYRVLQEMTKNGFWVDCCPIPGDHESYVHTYQRRKDAVAEEGQRWPKGSSRPDHFFVSRSVRFEGVEVLSGAIREGLSDHEPMIGDFTVESS